MTVDHPRITRVASVRCTATKKHPRTVQPVGGVAATIEAKRHGHCTRGVRHRSVCAVSGTATGYVWSKSPHSGATFYVHLALADVANDMHDNELWTRTKTIAAKTRLSRGSVSAALAALVAAGDLTVLDPAVRSDGRPSGGPVRYRFEMPDRPVVFDIRRREGVQPLNTPPVDKPGGGVQPSDTGCSTTAHPGAQPSDTINTKSNRTEPKSTDDPSSVAVEITRTFYDFVAAKTGGVKIKFNAVRNVVAHAFDQGCTPDEVRAALSTLWRERKMTAPTTSMIIDIVVRDRVDRPDMPTRARPDRVATCYRPGCDYVLTGTTCADGHEQPTQEFTVTIEDESETG